ncbi:MAG TPA: hypothetical protein DEO84_02195 [candidate division Zixibacteria bacterium]|nr:hypothetical protein [candidate division Zixibacteria bacterium]HBZ00108.1 hypothetical protein [candidate division Zixibacteria bacterium]
MIKQKIIEHLDEFKKLEQPWNDLVMQTDVDHIYMKHQWFYEWIKAYQETDSLAIVTIWQDGLLVAAAPIHRKPLRFKKITARSLSFLSSGVSPRCNFIAIDKPSADNLFTAIFALSKWDLLSTDNVESTSAVTQYYLDYLVNHMQPHYIEPGFQSLYLRSEGTWDSYWKSLSSNWRTNFKRYSLDKPGKVQSYEIRHLRTESEYQIFEPEMLKISEKSWKAEIASHLVANSALGRLYSCFTPIGLRNGWVYIPHLIINGEYVGYVYFLCYQDKYVGIRAEFDDSFKEFSPGNNLHLAIIKELYSSGRTCEYDLGPDAAYKRNFCNLIKQHHNILVGNKNIKGRGIIFAKNHILPLMRLMASTESTKSLP